MSVNYGSEKVKCPFYLEETKNAIKCEDFIAMSCNRIFENAVCKQKHKEKYCNTYRYKSCPHFLKVFEKYK